MSKKTFWDRRRKRICPVCDEEVEHGQYYIAAVDKPIRVNIFVHKEDCIEEVHENPEILQKVLKTL